ncbi:Hypp3630 [Branchiostoma lanceolatum]|uniref:Hypp3630 protein n=1 Tax=Branchiostoma lanceolatum TaxID=7740 RepID=A0A8K0EUJ0_BRALA|nr:Hypp3630 [Branchiostoma lanceolatum]
MQATMALMTLVMMACVAGVFAVPSAAPAPAAKGKFEHLTLPINERGTKFNEEADVDHDDRIVIFTVPDHNTVSNSMVMMDFNTRKMMTLFEKRKQCLLSDMPEDMAPFERVEEGLKLVANPDVPTTIVRTTSVETTQRVLMEQMYDRSSLSPQMRKMCEDFEIHRMEAIGEDVEIEEEKSELDRFFGRSSRIRRLVLNCPPTTFLWRCAAKTDSCIYYYECNGIAGRPGLPPTSAQCINNHIYHSDAWQCEPFCP